MGFVALSVLVTACGSSSGDDGAQDGVGDGGIAIETGATGPTGGETSPETTGSTGATGSDDAGVDVEVSLNNYLFDPTPVQVVSGDIVEVRNGNTKTPHTFTVVGEDVDLELGPLETERVEIALEPGTYDLVCRFHESLDMTGSLIVS
jgi:plastocyanin